MEENILYIVLGVVFLVVRYLMSSNKNKKSNTPAKPRRTVQKKTAQPKKSQNIDDIFSEFVKELEKKAPKAAPKPKPQVAKVKAKQPSVDWQEVGTTHLKPKKQLIDHEDYHGVSHKIDPSHQSSVAATVEQEDVYEFDLDNINWQDAIIAKEILDRRY